MGSKIIVTGGARGIGMKLVEGIVRDGGKAAIADVYEPNESWLQELGANAVFIPTDVTKRSDVQNMLQKTVDSFGRVDGLINNAMVTRAEHFLEISEESWNQFLAVGLTGVFHCSQIVAKYFVEHGARGNIVNLASINSFAAEQNASHYVTVKGGIAMLTKGMAVDLAPFGIRVNAVAPGLIETEKTAAIFQREDYQAQLQRIPLRRTGTGEEVANLITFLLSEKAAYITGEIYKMDGGLLSVIS